MIIIIRALPSEERVMEDMIPSQVGMSLQTKKIEEAKEAPKKRPKKLGQKMREKERRDNVTILLPHLCFKVAP